MEFAILSCCCFLFHLSEPTEKLSELGGIRKDDGGGGNEYPDRFRFILIVSFSPKHSFHSISALPLPALESRFLVSHFGILLLVLHRVILR